MRAIYRPFLFLLFASFLPRPRERQPMSSASYAQMMADKRQIERQVDAEIILGEALEANGVAPIQFMKQWKMSHHQFNTLAHYLHGVNDEEPVLPPALKALLSAMETRRAA